MSIVTLFVMIDTGVKVKILIINILSNKSVTIMHFFGTIVTASKHKSLINNALLINNVSITTDFVTIDTVQDGNKESHSAAP